MADFHRLSAVLIDLLASQGNTITYEDGEMIHMRGDPKPGLSIVKSGQVSMGNYGSDGKYRLTRVLSVGETFGEFTLFADLPRTHNAEALGGAEVIQVDRAHFEACCVTAPAIKDALLSSLAVKLHETLELMDDIRRLPLSVRLAKSLLAVSRQQQTLAIAITQGALADLIGVTVLSVHNALKVLVGKGLIRVGYGHVDIISAQEMEAWVQSQGGLQTIEAEL